MTKGRIAVLISGEYRSFDITAKTMPFIQAENVDLYFSTWTESRHFSKGLQIDINEPVDQQRIIDAIAPKKLTGLCLEDPSVLPNLKYNSRMVHRWRKGLDMIQASGIEYDVICITRPDLWYFETPRAIERYADAMDDDVLYTAWRGEDHVHKLDDVVFIAKASTMYKILGDINHEEWHNDPQVDWHTWFWHYVHGKGQTARIQPNLQVTFCRGNCQPTDKNEDIIRNEEAWRHAFIREQIRSYSSRFGTSIYGEEGMKRALGSRFKPKVALLVCGEYRTFDLASRTWQWLNALDFDIYMSTWDHHKIKCLSLGIDIDEAITMERVKGAMSKLPYSSIGGISLAKHELTPVADRYNKSKMMYHWRKAFDMMQESGIHYDCVIITRPDLTLWCQPDALLTCAQVIDADTLQTPWGRGVGANGETRVDDKFFVGTPKSIRRLLDVPYAPDKTEFHPYLAEHLNDADVRPMLGVKKTVILRGNVSEDDLSFDAIHRCAKDWWETVTGRPYGG